MRRALPTILFALIALACLWWAWIAFFDHDEIEHLHAAWLVVHGALPYRDFLEQHHPVLWYLLAPLVRLFASPHLLVFTVRCAGLGMLGLLLLVVSRLVRRIIPGAPARWVLLLLVSSFLFTANSLEVRPDPLMNLLFFSGLLAWLSFLERRRLWSAAAAGLLFGLAAAVLQKALFPEAVVLLWTAAACVWPRQERRQRWRRLAGVGIALLTTMGMVGLLALWMRAAGIWEDFFFWNYAFNRTFYLEANITEHFSAAKVFGRGFLQDPALWIAGVAGAVLMARDLWRRRPACLPAGACEPADDARLLLLVLAIAYGAFLAFNRFPFAQYFIVLMPLVAIFAGRALVALPGQRWGWIVPLAATAMVAEFVILVAFFETNEDQRGVQERVLRETAPAQTIFVPPPRHPIFRRDGAYFWFNARMIGDVYARGVAEGRYRGEKLALEAGRWRQTPPAVVFLDPREPSTHPFRWEEHAAAYAPMVTKGLFRRR